VKLSVISYLRPKIILTIFKTREEVLEFIDLRDSNNNIILTYYYKSKILAKKLLRSIE
jgi:hypothetical protein